MRKSPTFTFLVTLLTGFLVCGNLYADSPLNPSSPANPLSLAAPQFLPIDQAYQLHPSIEGKQLILDWNLAPGYYLYQHRFKFSANGAPITVDADYATGISKYDDYYEKELEVFYNHTRIQLPLAQLPKHLTVESQACADAGLCYPPRQQHLIINGVIDNLSVKLTDNISTAVTTISSPLAASLPLILLLALIGGAILNLMPCVFPVLSIKAMSMANAGLNNHSKHLHGLAYTLGVVITFVAVAALLIALRSAGSAIGWGFQLQSPLFIGALIYLFVLMGLSFSGLFEFGTRLMNIGQSSSSGDSLSASFMTGVLATVVASPCTAPFMGTALGFALTQTTATALLVFVFLGLGMSLPFLLLSWWPGLVEKMPQPGPWMERFKQFLAFPLYLSAAWLLWVLGHQTNVDTVISLLISLILISMAIWLTHGASGPRARIVKLILAALLIAAAIALPLNSYRNHVTGNEQLVQWQPYTAKRLSDLRENGHPVFVNLTADWCLTCLANEKLALGSERFQQALQEKNIVYLKGDWTNYNSEITTLLNQNHRNGVPLYLLYPRGNGEPVLLPQLLTKSIVLKAIDTIP